MSLALPAVVPPGSYLKAPGEVARCPVGEWKADNGLPGHCTKCAPGVITEQEGSTSEKDCKSE